MRKFYPYLEDSYNQDDINEKRDHYNFLQTIDNFLIQKQYVKITLLDWMERPLKELQGELSSGSITKDGTSSVRRTCSFNAAVDYSAYDPEDAESDFSINKKIFIEIGIKNYSDRYPEYPILWFPQGVFYIQSFAINSSAGSSVNISISLGDKMLGLSGMVGGVFSATTVLDTMDTQNPAGEYISKKVKIYDIIQELVHHIGGEDLNNIVIEDVPDQIKTILQWNGSQPLYIIMSGNLEDQSYYPSLTPPAPDKAGVVPPYNEYIAGMDIGYQYDDFVYTGELVASTGDTVTNILDQIVDYLGNYEYFYDEMGVFHFREIRNYLNTTLAETVIQDMNDKDYLVDVTVPKSSFTFSDDTNLVSISSTPQYENIKNDYIVEGKRKLSNSDEYYNVKYHLAIDNKPIVGNEYYNLLLYKEEGTNLIKAAFPIVLPSVEKLPDVGNFNVIYKCGNVNIDSQEYKEYVYEQTEKLPALEIQLNGKIKQDANGNDIYEVDKDTGKKIPVKEKEGLVDKIAAQQKVVADIVDQIQKYVFITSDTLDGYVEALNNRLTISKKTFETATKDLDKTYEEVKKLYEKTYFAKDIFGTNKGYVSKGNLQAYLDILQQEANILENRYKTTEDILKKLQDKENPTLDDLEQITKVAQELAKIYQELTDTKQRRSQLQRAVENHNKVYDNVVQYNDQIKGISELLPKLAPNGDFIKEEKKLQQLQDDAKALREEIARLKAKQDPSNVFYYWAGTEYKLVNRVAYYNNTDGIDNGNETSIIRPYIPTDWRTELYLQGMLASNTGRDITVPNTYSQYQEVVNAENTPMLVTQSNWLRSLYYNQTLQRTDVNFYWEELEAFWPTIYDLEHQQFYGEDGGATKIRDLTTGNYFLDFIDPVTSQLGDYAISAIGRRTDAVVSDDVNCLFEPIIPEIIWINVDDEDQTKIEQIKQKCTSLGLDFVQITSEYYTAMGVGGRNNAAFDQIKYELWTHTTYQKTLSLTGIPAFYLEPNTRITINDKSTNTYGDFMVTNISLPLGAGSMMALTCNECVQKM